MAEIYVSAERHVFGPPSQVYGLLADYRQHHPRILPGSFSDFRVEEGGVGSGTLISFKQSAGGRERFFRMRVEEPEPARVLAEKDVESSLVTTFTVDPSDGGSQVKIETRWQGGSGIGGLMERTFAPRVLRRIYLDELNRLDAYSREQGPAS